MQYMVFISDSDGYWGLYSIVILYVGISCPLDLLVIQRISMSMYQLKRRYFAPSSLSFFILQLINLNHNNKRIQYEYRFLRRSWRLFCLGLRRSNCKDAKGNDKRYSQRKEDNAANRVAPSSTVPYSALDAKERVQRHQKANSKRKCVNKLLERVLSRLN